MNSAIEKPPEKILERLEELRKWQEEQQKLLIQRQETQRQLLSEEQRLLYAKLGYSNSNSNSVELGDISASKQSLENTSCFDTSGLKSSSKQENEIETQSNGFDDGEKVKTLIKRKFLKKGEGLTNRFKVNPETFRLHNLPKYKYAARVNSILRNSQKEITPKSVLSKNTIVELPKKFQKPTPYDAQVLSKVHQNRSSSASVDIRSSECLALDRDEATATPSKDAMNTKSHEPIAWADVFNPNCIKPISVENLRKFTEFNSTDSSLFEEDDNNISLFELLERKAQDGSVLIDSSILKRWVTNFWSPSKSSIDESLIDLDDATWRRVSPLPCDIEKPILKSESDSSSTESVANDLKTGRCRVVRFSDNVVVNEITKEFESGTEDSFRVYNIVNSFESPTKGIDSCNIKPLVELVDTSMEGTSIVDALTNSSLNAQQLELIEKTEQLKARLVDLEQEIEQFRNQNAELTKLRQECKMEKIRIEQERVESHEKLKDERIKMEMQLHDERMQMEDEKRKYEKLMKENRVKTRKEGDEVCKLKELLDKLQKENREKETKHTAAQSRLRAQIRNLEKDLKDCTMEIDALNKEKRRLEGENARLTRQNNNKMLHEINKSIAKLVPKMPVPVETEVKNKNPKPVVAKVISHTVNNAHQRRKSKSSPQIRQKPWKPQENSSNSDSDSMNEHNSVYFKKQSNLNRSQTPSDLREAEVPLAMNENSKAAENPLASHDEFKREIVNADGSKDIWYTNGNLKKISADGMLIRMLYYNKDIKETNINEGTVKYYYAETNTWHTTYLDGLEILEFPNGQTEHRYKDGTVEIHFENGSIRITNPSDPTKEEEWRYPNGTRLVQLKTGDKILSFANGQKEIHTKMHKRREYPDGTVKIVYPDGSQETRYSNGRVRLKDKDGNLIMDSAEQ